MSLESMRAATVHLGSRSYQVLAGDGLLDRLGEAILEHVPDVSGCVLVTSPSVDKLYGIIQEKFGDTKEAIQAKLDKLHLK